METLVGIKTMGNLPMTFSYIQVEVLDLENIVIAAINIFCGLLFVGLAIPLYKGKVKMNYLYGVRFSNSFKSDENWYKINKYGAKRMMIWSIPVFVVGLYALFVPVSETLLVAFSFAPLTVIIAAIESYIFSKKL